MQNKFNKNWFKTHLNDFYVQLARKEDYRARSVYKLKEIDERYHLIHQGMIIVDLGSAPGSWSQYIQRKLSKLKEKKNTQSEKNKLQSQIFAIDILPMREIFGVTCLHGSFSEKKILKQLTMLLPPKRNKVDLVLSDVAPNFSGIPVTDAMHMKTLAELVLEFCNQYLMKNGTLLMKCFHSNEYDQIFQIFKKKFKMVLLNKPKASRNRSAEVFLLGKEFGKV